MCDFFLLFSFSASEHPLTLGFVIFFIHDEHAEVEAMFLDITGVLEDGERERVTKRHKEDKGLEFDNLGE